MLSDFEIQNYYLQHNVPPAAREYIRNTRESDPARLIGIHAKKNVCTWMASKKMEWAIQAESRTGELGFAILFEYLDSVLEIWDQVQPVAVVRTIRNGSKRKGSYIADYLTIDTAGPKVYEVKPEKLIQENLRDNPVDWQVCDNGVTYIPGFEAFAAIGLSYEILSTKDLNPIRTANLRLLLSAHHIEQKVTEDLKQTVLNVMTDYSWLPLSELAKKLKIVDLTPLLQLISDGILFASLDDELLTQAESAYVASTPQLAALSLETRLLNAKNSLFADGVEPVAQAKVPSTIQAQTAINILERVNSGEKSRQVRRWRAAIKKGAENNLSPFQSVLPNWYGNPTSQLNVVVANYINQFIGDYYATNRRMPTGKSFSQYELLAKNEHPEYPPTSRPTFIRYTRLYDPEKMAFGRGGQRAANAVASPSEVGDREMRAMLPFERAAMDHHLAKIACVLVSANGTVYTAFPWVSALIDLATDEVLAAWVSFRSPSTRSCAMVLRQCVRKHRRLPQEIIVDRGSDFVSVYFTAFLLHCGVSPVLRPTAHPRYGSQVERLFEEFRTQWLCMRPGNRVDFSEARAVSSSHSPANNAELTLEDMLTEFFEFLEWRSQKVIGTNAKSPRELLEQGLNRYDCVGIKMEEDYDFVIASAVDVRKYKVNPARGIHTDTDIHYWHPSLSHLAARKRPAEVRMEPEDPYRIYALVNNKWEICFATQQQRFHMQDPVIRMAEAIRVLDGKEARNTAKKEAEYSVIRHLMENDHKLSARKALCHTRQPKPAAVEETESSIFDEVRNSLSTPLTISLWGKK